MISQVHTTESLQSQDGEFENYHYQLEDGERYQLTDGELRWLHNFVDGRYSIADHIIENMEDNIYTVDTIGLGQAMDDDGMFPKIVMLSEDSVLHRIAFYSAYEPEDTQQ
jgi:hypothetical protein